MKDFLPISTNIYQRETQADDPRLGHKVKIIDSDAALKAPSGVVIQGYPDDTGVKLSFGRIGASIGPDEIRKDLYGLVWHSGLRTPLYDIGNLHLSEDLNEQTALIKKYISEALKNHKLVTLGGGHDYAYPDIAGFLEYYKNSKFRPLVVNFDAHLDMRKPFNGNSSGTPFYRLLEDYSGFDLVVVGIQNHCNAEAHFKFAKSKKVTVVNYDNINKAFSILRKKLNKKRPFFLSIDFDVMSSAFAPGVSAAWPIGLNIDTFFKLTDLCFSKKPDCLGVYEVSPPLDENRKTSRLAALTIYKYLESLK